MKLIKGIFSTTLIAGGLLVCGSVAKSHFVYNQLMSKVRANAAKVVSENGDKKIIKTQGGVCYEVEKIMIFTARTNGVPFYVINTLTCPKTSIGTK